MSIYVCAKPSNRSLAWSWPENLVTSGNCDGTVFDKYIEYVEFSPTATIGASNWRFGDRYSVVDRFVLSRKSNGKAIFGCRDIHSSKSTCTNRIGYSGRYRYQRLSLFCFKSKYSALSKASAERSPTTIDDISRQEPPTFNAKECMLMLFSLGI